MPYCYVIYSEKLNRFYTGICQGEITERISKHNNHTYGKHRFTAKATDWVPFLEITCKTMSQARRIELHIKRMKSAQYIRNLAKYPELKENLLNRFG